MNGTKSPLMSLGMMGPLVSLIAFGLNKWKPGLGIDEATIGAAIDQGALLVGILTGMYGRWRATKAIG